MEITQTLLLYKKIIINRDKVIGYTPLKPLQLLGKAYN